MQECRIFVVRLRIGKKKGATPFLFSVSLHKPLKHVLPYQMATLIE